MIGSADPAAPPPKVVGVICKGRKLPIWNKSKSPVTKSYEKV
jgi:hypothetical protein